MKRYIVLFAIALFASCGSGDEQLLPMNVPQPVLKAFDVKYPAINKCIWFKATADGKTIYKAEYKKDGKHIKADFDEQGNFIKEE